MKVTTLKRILLSQEKIRKETFKVDWRIGRLAFLRGLRRQYLAARRLVQARHHGQLLPGAQERTTISSGWKPARKMTPEQLATKERLVAETKTRMEAAWNSPGFQEEHAAWLTEHRAAAEMYRARERVGMTQAEQRDPRDYLFPVSLGKARQFYQSQFHLQLVSIHKFLLFSLASWDFSSYNIISCFERSPL